MSSAIVPTYARADLTFERGDGCWLTTVGGERYLDFGAGIAVVSLGHSHPHLVETLRVRAPSSGTRPTCSRCRKASGSPNGSPTRPLPISCSSPIPALRPTRRRSRWRVGDSMSTATPALSRSHLRRRLSRADARDDRGGRPGQISGRLRAEGRWLRSDPDHRSRGGRGGGHAGDGGDPDRADPGRGRRARRAAVISARLCARSATSMTCR